VLIAPELERVFRDARDLMTGRASAEIVAYAEALESCSDERVRAFFRALQYAGVTEDVGPNDDADGHIDRWLDGAGVDDGNAWCASFCSEFLPPGEARIAGALNLLRRYPRIPADACHLLDLFGYATDDKGHGHVGYVIGRGEGGTGSLVMTLEGNASNAVRVQLRPAQAPGLRYARAPFAVAGVCPPIIRAGVRLVETQAFVDTR
jgi:hypothetical protein